MKLTSSSTQGVPERLDYFEVEGPTLSDALVKLQKTLEEFSHDPINVLTKGDAGQRPLSKMVLRNVTGADALRLLATAAGCELEPIMTMELARDPEHDGIVGYEIRPQSESFGSGLPGHAASPAQHRMVA